MLERQSIEAELKLMQAQVEPHFLFNTLASVQYLTGNRRHGNAAAGPSACIFARRAAAVTHPRTTLGQGIDLIGRI